MISIYNDASAGAALCQPLQPKLRTLIVERLALAESAGLQNFTHILAVQPHDGEAEITAEIGFSPVVNPIDSRRYGQPGFVPYWPFLRDLGEWYELIQTIGSDYAVVLLIQKAVGVWPALLEMCRHYCVGEGE